MLLCAAIKRDLVDLYMFFFLSQVFSCEISSVFGMKYLYKYFSSYL